PHHVVVNVGDVADASYRVTETAKPPGQDVEGVVGEGVAEVAAVIGGDAADVEADCPVARIEQLERPAGRVEEADHGSSKAADRRRPVSRRRVRAGGLWKPGRMARAASRWYSLPVPAGAYARGREPVALAAPPRSRWYTPGFCGPVV